eukprot:COSAG02_NODE_17849_length_976_cov_1.183580_1_plen_171_part_10
MHSAVPSSTGQKQQQEKKNKKAHSYDKRPTYLRAAEMKQAERKQRRGTHKQIDQGEGWHSQMGAARESGSRQLRQRRAGRGERPPSRLPEGKPKGSRHLQAVEDVAESMVEPHRMRHRTLELMVAAEARGSSGGVKSHRDHVRAGSKRRDNAQRERERGTQSHRVTEAERH